MTGKHTTTTTRSRLRRRVLGVPVFGWLLALLGAGVAVAAIVVTLGFSGTFSFTIDPTYGVVFTNAMSHTDEDCEVSHTSTNLSFDSWDDFGPLSECTIAVEVENTGDTDVYFADFVTADPMVRIIKASGGLACQGVVAPAGTATINLKVLIGSGSGPGTYDIDFAGSGIQWSDVAEGNCDTDS